MSKNPKTIVETLHVNGFDTKVVKSRVTGGYFIHDDASLVAYCQAWWEAVKKDKYNFIYLPDFYTYAFIGLKSVYFIQFKYGAGVQSETQRGFFETLKRCGHSHAKVGTFSEFIERLKAWGLYDT